MTAHELLDHLNRLLPAQFDTVLFKLGVPTVYIPSTQAAQATRAVEVVRYLESAGRIVDSAEIVLGVIGARPAPEPAAPERPSKSPPSIGAAVASMISTFLSHQDADKPLVEAVAAALGRRGIVPWLDKHELFAGQSLTENLRVAIDQQSAFSPFLSPEALASPWAMDELKWAIDLWRGEPDRIIPVYLARPLDLVAASPLLVDEGWVHPDGTRVDRLGCSRANYDRRHYLVHAEPIANDIARSLYRVAGLADREEVSIVIDQRGGGRRTGSSGIPANARRHGPALIFRPDTDNRSFVETLHGDAWTSFAATIRSSLDAALGQLRGNHRRIHIFGTGQMGLAFLLGRYFDVTSGVSLHCYNSKPDTMFTSDAPWPGGGNPMCETTNRTDPYAPEPLPPKSHEIIALYVGPPASLGPNAGAAASASGTRPPPVFLDAVREHVRATTGARVVWVETGNFASSEEVLTCIANVQALLQRLQIDHKTRKVQLYAGLPFNALVLLAAHLTHVGPEVEFMEFRRDLRSPASADSYVALPIPR